MSDTLREMVLREVSEKLEKTHDAVAKLNDDLRFTRGLDLSDLDDEQLAFLKQVVDQCSGFVIVQLMLEIMIVKKFKERA